MKKEKTFKNQLSRKKVIKVVKDVQAMCDMQIPYYAYGDNEAGCKMALRLNEIEIELSKWLSELTEEEKSLNVTGNFYTKISKEEFLNKVKLLISYDNDEGKLSEDVFPYEMSARIGQDLSKIEFDRENCTYFNSKEPFGKYPFIGHKELSRGLHTFWMQIGGDWEYPVCFIFYWGDGELRAYIPEDGNAYNKKEKCAYGSDSLNEIDYEIVESEIDENKMINDILKHIKKK